LKTDYDCIIVGAGPAGSTAAYHLAREGIDVLLLDSNAHPRSKPCGGGLTIRARNLLHLDPSEVIEKDVKQMVITYSYQNPVLLETPAPFAYMLMRDRFDSLLLNAAVSEGVDCIQQCKASDIEITPYGVQVHTSCGSFTTKTLIGADGANGVTHKVLNPHIRRNLAFCIEGKTLESINPNTSNKDAVFLTYGNIKRGYAWVFPKQDNFSIGVGTFNKNSRIKDYFLKHLSSLGLPNASTSVHMAAHPIPLPTRHFRISGERVILIGDAAGLADPLSGEGLYGALKSARLAAECINHSLRNSNYNMMQYTQNIQDTMYPDLRSALYISKLFYSFPWLFHRVFMANRQLVLDYFAVISDAGSYASLYSEVQRQVPSPMQKRQ
jgi:geranylgeranyl reductase family protein